ncbi:5-methyltetrahydropteroyltriglutamate--homocysteine S-methyltransferase [Myroides pelagicus]|uniref:5-methyltetrahydropteroyltriglutamate--homocysteine methyltransferase n=1 Tax=Myroides pelagicus TaxID=270914 RepID=A0A7K1GM61_9FLAO|nr:5-methyltetrahydropteroyltriglutamate--homocysteine S-methyltransferase [Myroides pelagicus]MEC4113078.1 5-methyltetrahydropteroyltriglutamate--homocysteine S-methyltransferase [Myroides pelagicus]MTH29982.1 5-methyltetrahydropteroyltriglutamate--homocysteine S-methyltransferase [Myroides pelagicus]
MQTQVLGYPRIGSQRELKKANELYWAGKISKDELQQVAQNIRRQNWELQQSSGINLIPSNDFSFYDQVLDWSLTIGAIPKRYQPLQAIEELSQLDLYFAMARGYQKGDLDITAMEMTKWFDTNYHYIVPEFYKGQSFSLTSLKIVEEYKEAKKQGIETKPVILGLVSYLLLGKAKEEDFNVLSLVDSLLPVYVDVIKRLVDEGVEYIQIDEPFLVLDLTVEQKAVITSFYHEIQARFPKLKVILATYFGDLGECTTWALSLPVEVLHLDLIRGEEQLDKILNEVPLSLKLSLGVVDGRNIWKNDYQKSLILVDKAVQKLGSDRVIVATSCSLLHSPFDLASEIKLSSEIKQWLAFAKQKVNEVSELAKLVHIADRESVDYYRDNKLVHTNKRESKLIHNTSVKQRVKGITESDSNRKDTFSIRQPLQHKALELPLFPTTTIGSFPQTTEVRQWRAKFKKGELSAQEYEQLLKEETARAIHWQEEIGLDVLVHGEFERNDMVEYFGEQLEGFAFTQNGWVQSYGSRCVKPPVIYGDVYRSKPLTVFWSAYAQSITSKLVKGMLTGPVTILQWSFVRNDIPRSETCTQIALAIRDEVLDLEKANIQVIQIDEPAIREGLPLRKAEWASYLDWAVRAFRLSAAGVKNETQIHTHMCYSEFNDIIEHIAAMDADVITIECSRSQMDLLDAFAEFNYPNEIGPGVYDIHSPRVPKEEEMLHLIKKAENFIPSKQLWINPDCGLKTRHWDETEKALIAMVHVAKRLRKESLVEAV